MCVCSYNTPRLQVLGSIHYEELIVILLLAAFTCTIAYIVIADLVEKLSLAGKSHA